MYLELFEALQKLAWRYERYCDSPSDKTRQECIAAHQRAIDCLDDVAAAKIDPLIDEQIEAGNSASEQALQILEQADTEDLRYERMLGARVGFSPAEIEKFGKKARDALRKKNQGITIDATSEIRTILERLHDQVRHAFSTSVHESRRRKDAHRADAREYIRMQLWMVGAIVVNAEHRDLFHLSYATSVGMSRVRPIQRKALVTPTCERPSLSETDAEAA